MTSARTKLQPRVLVIGVVIALGFLTVLASLGGLLAWSVPHLQAGTVPDEPYARNYVLHPWPAALHIGPGLLYLIGAPLQLSARFRRKHLTLHRRLGRVVVASGVMAAVFALVVGISNPYDGAVEAAATVVFGGWFLVSLSKAVIAARRRELAVHRRWMIRAFATGIGIAAIRVWIGILGAIQSAVTGTMAMSPQQGTYGAAFWLGFGSAALVGEWWLRHTARPQPPAPFNRG